MRYRRLKKFFGFFIQRKKKGELFSEQMLLFSIVTLALGAIGLIINDPPA
jgi:ABC-type lipoprotein release transport system permease subunit